MGRIIMSLLILFSISCKDESKEDLDDVHLGKGYIDNPDPVDSTDVPPQKTTFEVIVGGDTLSK